MEGALRDGLPSSNRMAGSCRSSLRPPWRLWRPSRRTPPPSDGGVVWPPQLFVCYLSQGADDVFEGHLSHVFPVFPSGLLLLESPHTGALHYIDRILPHTVTPNCFRRSLKTIFFVIGEQTRDKERVCKEKSAKFGKSFAPGSLDICLAVAPTG